MSSFTESDYYVLVQAAENAWRKGQSRMRVRTSTIMDIGAEHLVTTGDRASFDSYQEDMKDLHAVEVDVLALREVLSGLTPPASDAALSSQPFLESVPPEGRVRNMGEDRQLDDWRASEIEVGLAARGLGPDGTPLAMGHGLEERRAKARERVTNTPPLDELPRDAIPPEGRLNSVDPRSADPKAPRSGNLESGNRDQVIQGVDEQADRELSDPQKHFVENEEEK